MTVRAAILRPSVLHRTSTSRLFITVLLAVAVPLCCCNVRSWLGACAPCDAATPRTTTDPAARGHAFTDSHDHESDHHATGAAAAHESPEPGPSPCGTGHDDEDCACGKHDTLLTVAKSAPKFPMPVSVATLSFPTSADASAFPPLRTIERGLRVGARPPATLLRLHCALIL